VVPGTARAILRALRILSHHKVIVSWIGDKVEFRSATPPPPPVISMLDLCESAIVEVMRPNGDGRSFLDRARERYAPLLGSVAKAKPPDATGDQWRRAFEGLPVFLLSGWSDEAELLGWPKAELYAIPALWSQIHLCGVGLLIGDKEVVEVTPGEIRVRTASGAIQAFRRKPTPDFGVIYRQRLRELARNFPNGEDADEPKARAYDFAVEACRAHRDCSLEEAKTEALNAISAMKRGPLAKEDASK